MCKPSQIQYRDFYFIYTFFCATQIILEKDTEKKKIPGTPSLWKLRKNELTFHSTFQPSQDLTLEITAAFWKIQMSS